VLPKSGSWLEAKMRRVLANTFGEVWATALGSVFGVREDFTSAEVVGQRVSLVPIRQSTPC
jgi:hypothetical protein